MVIFYKKSKKVQWNSIEKNRMNLNIRKMTNHPPSPEPICNNNNYYYFSVWQASNGQSRDYLVSRMAIENVNSCTSILPNTCAWDEYDLNKTKKHASRKEWSLKKIKLSRKKNPSAKRELRPTLQSPRGRYSPKKWMKFLTNLTYTYNPQTTPWGIWNELKRVRKNAAF